MIFNFNFNFFSLEMKSIKVTCCSCFFDQCVWLSTQSDHDIKFSEIQSIKSDIFIKEKRYHRKHFDNVYINNFDLIHHKSRGDPLEYSEKFYKTISISKVKDIDYPKSYQFVAAAIKSRRDDVFLEKDVIKKHFQKDIELELMERNIFLSSMKKKAFLRKKGKCNFLKFDS